MTTGSHKPPSSHWFAIFRGEVMLIAPLIREPGRVVSTGRALVPTQPTVICNFIDLFILATITRPVAIGIVWLTNERSITNPETLPE
jgi:hypothetical protein